MRMRAGVAVAALWASGCGLIGGDSPGTPLFDVHGELIAGTTPVATQAPLRAALVWERYPEQAVDCMEGIDIEQQSPWECLVGSSLALEAVTEDVAVSSQFPSTFSLPVYSLPGAEKVMGAPGRQLGLATVAAYADGNRNGRLDPVSPEATTSEDEVLGYQYSEVDGVLSLYTVVYRDGALHPAWKLFSFTHCPEPPQGFSIVKQVMTKVEGRSTYTPTECVFLPVDSSVQVAVDPSGAVGGQLMCSPNTSPFYKPWVRPDAPPPEGSTQSCREYFGEAVLIVNLHPERFCSATNSVVYALRDRHDGAWDMRSSPPEWWPCPVP